MITSRHPNRVKAAQYLALLGYMIFLAVPLVWLLSSSFKSSRELVALHPSLIPQHPTIANYTAALNQADIVHAGLNSLKVAVITALLTTLVGLPAAYVLARTRGIISKLGLGYILVSQMFPLILIIIPLFLVLRDLHLTNTHTGLILVYLVWSLPFILWMLQSYIRNIPRDLEEAAAVDGARRIQIVIRIIAPLLAPGVVVTLLFAFISAWNEFFFALVLVQSPGLVTLPVKLAQFVGIEGVIRLGPLAAASLLATIPSLLFFSVMQRWLTSGLLSGAVKG
ncbi:MAG: multiple sugar transport system permease protein [Gaiellaceae bacterium]|nr:multiple sugar transport system permease protein [Gaiellaceae bacterium]